MTSLNNVTNPSNESNVAAQPVVSDEVADKAVEALKVLHALFHKAGSELPSTFDLLDYNDVSRVCARAITALKKRDDSNLASVFNQIRSKVQAVVAAAQANVQSKYDQIMAVENEMVRELALKSIPKELFLEAKSFRSVFPNATDAEILGKLLSFGYKGNGATRGPKAGQHTSIVVSALPEKPKAAEQAVEGIAAV